MTKEVRNEKKNDGQPQASASTDTALLTMKKYRAEVKRVTGDYTFETNACDIDHVHRLFEKYGKGGRVKSIKGIP